MSYRKNLRKGDPKTPHEATAKIQAKKIGIQRAVLRILRREEIRGATTWEISRDTGILNWTITPRMVELEREGLVLRTKQRRRNPDRGRSLIVWVLSEHKEWA